ncbi:hypothetical protein, unknown function [Leishmania tarentolae]|uniref:Uncharacterized protein n=1 Tax=Leishmania tarentolae TaxID=5689 RepID=A0A640K8Y8_LEITA|nr:hypothetical protein, unknown function [Leishmania tarentolae]
MPLFFSKRLLRRSSSRPNRKTAASPQRHATGAAQESDTRNVTAVSLVFPRYLDGRDVCACVFSLRPVDDRWVEAMLRQLCARRCTVLEKPFQIPTTDMVSADGRAKKRTRSGAASESSFIAAGVATQSHGRGCRTSAYTQRVMGNLRADRIHDHHHDDGATVAGVWACALHLGRDMPLDKSPSESVGPTTVGTMTQNCHAAGVGSAMESHDATTHPSFFSPFAVLGKDSGEAEAVTADVCDAAAGDRSYVIAETRPPVTHRPRRVQAGAHNSIPKPVVNSEELRQRWSKFVQQSEEEAEGARWRGDLLSPLPSRSRWAHKRTCAVLAAERCSDLTAPSCCTTTEAEGAIQSSLTTPDPCRGTAHWPLLRSSTTLMASLRVVGTLTVCGSLPQRRFADVECLWRFSFTAPSIPHALRMPPGAHACDKWSIILKPTTWPGRQTEGGHAAEVNAGAMRSAAGATIAASEVAVGAQLRGRAVMVPQLAVVRHSRRRCLIGGNDKGGTSVGKEGCRAASEALPAAPRTHTGDGLTAEALRTQWGALLADVRESRMTQERQRAAFAHDGWLAAAASLGSVSESVAEALASLPQLCATRSASHCEGEESVVSALDVGPLDSMRGVNQVSLYPVRRRRRWTLYGSARTPWAQHAPEPTHRLPETCVAFRSVPDDAEATRAQLVLTLQHWARDMPDVRWRAASWLPWDSWIAAFYADTALPLLLLPLSSRHAPLLMLSSSRVQRRLRITASEEDSAASTAHLTADSLLFGGRPLGHSTEDPARERQPWLALDAAPQLLSEAMISATARPGGGLLAAVTQEVANDAKRQRCKLRAAAVAACEALAGVCERSARASLQGQVGDAAAMATAAEESAADTLHCLSLRHRTRDLRDVGVTSIGGHERSEGSATAGVGTSTPDAASPSPKAASLPSSPAVADVVGSGADLAAVGLGEHSRLPPPMVLLLAPSESPSAGEISSVDGAGTDDCRSREVVGRKRTRSAAASPSATVSLSLPVINAASLKCVIHASSPLVERDALVPLPCAGSAVQRSTTPQRLLAAWIEQQCHDTISAAEDSPSLTAAAAITEAGAMVPSSGHSLREAQPSSQSSSPLPSDALSVTHACLHGDRFRRMRRWLVVPPSPTRLPLAPSQRRRRVTAVIHASVAPTTSTARTPVLQSPTRWLSCTRQALLQDTQPVEFRCALASSTPWAAQTHGERAETDARETPAVCANVALSGPTGELVTTAPAGCSSRITWSVHLPVKPPRELGRAPMRPVAVWKWAQLTLHNYAADALAGVMLPGACTIEAHLRLADGAPAPMASTAPPVAAQSAAHRFDAGLTRPVTGALRDDCPLQTLPPLYTTHQGQTSVSEMAVTRFLMTAAHWRQLRAQRKAQRLAFYRLILVHDATPPPSTPLQLRFLSQCAESEGTALPGAAGHITAGTFTVGEQLYRDELQRNDAAELAECVRDALVRAQHAACMRLFQRRSGHGEERAATLPGVRRARDVCCSAATRTCATPNATHGGSCTPLPASLPVPLASWVLPAPASSRGCLACERGFHRIICDGMRRDGWLFFHTLWYDALSEYVSPYSPRTWPSCLLNAVQGNARTHATSSEEDGSDESAHDAALRQVCAPRTHAVQCDIDFLDAGPDAESRASPLEVSAHEIRWHVDTSDEDDEYRQTEAQDDGPIVLHDGHSTSQWCCFCLASREHLMRTIMAQGEELAAATEQRVAALPTSERGAQPPLCPAWWRTRSTMGAAVVSDASLESQHYPASIIARTAARSQAVRYACRALFFGLVDAAGAGTLPALQPWLPLLSSWSLPSWLAVRPHSAAQEGTQDDVRDEGVCANSTAARVFSRLRRYAAHLLSYDGLARGAAAMATMGAETPTAQSQHEDEEDVEGQVAPLRRCRYTRHVCSFSEETQSLQTWLLPHWWAKQKPLFDVTRKAREMSPRSWAGQGLEHALNGSHATISTETPNDVDKDADSSSLFCFLPRREESEAWVQLLHHAHLRQLRRPYGPLFGGKRLLQYAPLGGCIADAEVHYTYLAAMLRQRSEESYGTLSAYVLPYCEPHGTEA